MSCAACQARVEKAVSAVEGVSSCSVSLLTNSMGVEGTASPGEIIRAVGLPSKAPPKIQEKDCPQRLRRKTPLWKIMKLRC